MTLSFNNWYLIMNKVAIFGTVLLIFTPLISGGTIGWLGTAGLFLLLRFTGNKK